MRKEMENLLILQGEKILRDSSFVDSHATLYWNVLYGEKSFVLSFDVVKPIFQHFNVSALGTHSINCCLFLAC